MHRWYREGMKFDANALLRVARQIFRVAEPIVRDRLNDGQRSSSPAPHSQQRSEHNSSSNYDDAPSGSWQFGGYPGDYSGNVADGSLAAYSPNPNGTADPGEVVWAWVPYEEDYSRGKDRPVLIVGNDGQYLLGLMLTSKDRDNKIHHDRDYLDVGTGGWDSKGRPSEAKLDRVIRLRQDGIRREGAVIAQDRYDDVARAMRENR